MITLPTEATKPVGVLEPSRLMIFGQPKIGKTRLFMDLPNSLMVDLEEGSKYYAGMKINVKEEAMKEGKHPVAAYLEIANLIKKANQDAGKKVYDFIGIDTLTVLEDWATIHATSEYKKSAIGKNFSGGNIVKELSQGAGYSWQRDSFEMLYKAFDGLANKCLILFAHVKTASIQKKGETLNAKDVNLTGKLKLMITSDMDATGYMYREKSSNKNALSFLTDEQDLVTGSRIPALAGKTFLISEVKEGDVFESYWEKIFPSIKETK